MSLRGVSGRLSEVIRTHIVVNISSSAEVLQEWCPLRQLRGSAPPAQATY